MSGGMGWWRHLALAGAVAGLLASTALPAPAGWLPCLLAAATAVAVVGRRLLASREVPAPVGIPWLACVSALGGLAGIGVGDARIAAIEAGALSGPVGAEVEVEGFVDGVPRRSFGEVRFPLDTPGGRLLVVAREPIGDLTVGSGLRLEGRLVRPEDPFRRDEAERLGASLVLESDSLSDTGGVRAGLVGALDRARSQAEEALGAGMGEEQAALARGFVLGQDDLIDPATREEFNRAGLAHLLAVSGQNVMLLAILGGVLCAAFGARLRTRLVLILLLIAAYVPIAGAGPSIQRAGVMGAAGILATIAGRPSDRAYPALLAAAVTLAINPRFGADAGWQLSFAAVLGIMLWARPLRDLLARPFARVAGDRIAGPLAEGAAITVAATVATAPLIAHGFEELSIAALPANLVALPLIAPVMWVGMAIGLLGQLPSVAIGPVDPVAILGSIEGILAGLVAAVAHGFSAQEWAQVDLPLPGAGTVVAVYVAIAAGLTAGLAAARRRRMLAPARAIPLGLAAAALLALVPFAVGPGSSPSEPPEGALRITALDVGQGDAVLVQPPRGSPVLIDAGPPGDAAADALGDLGIGRLRALFVTHDDLDHAGGVGHVLQRVEVSNLIRARPAREAEAAARAAGTRILRTAEGRSFGFGRLRLDVLWPPRERLTGPPSDGNSDGIVLVARFAGWSALLTGDAEQEATHLDPGPIDVLKVAHHGSDDAALGSLLDRSVPRVALISVGSDNGYGHPTDATIATLVDRAVCVLRTDDDGAVSVEIGPRGLDAWTAEGILPAARPGCAG